MASAFTQGRDRGNRTGAASRMANTFGALLLLALAACGGGGGDGGGDGSGALELNVIKVTVSDSFGSKVTGAAVTSSRGTLATDANGVALLSADGSSATTALTVSYPGFVDQSITAPVMSGTVSEVAVILDRVTAPAGGSLSTRSGTAATVDVARQRMVFEVELALVNGASAPIENLVSSAFTLVACAPDLANDRTDCVRGDAVDTSYVALTAAPESLSVVAAGAIRPYAATLLLDQSGSIAQSDPGGARLFAGKVFLGSLGADDRVLLSAFASGAGTAIAAAPLDGLRLVQGPG